MENEYKYFKRDISWLSFNYRVLLEADCDTLPLYERINFISIYSSNLEEFYKIRVAEHKTVVTANQDPKAVEEAKATLHEITDIVNSQLEDRIRIYEKKILPALRENNIVFYQHFGQVESFHQEFISSFFDEDIFPYLQPVPVDKANLRTFLRDNRLYMAVRLVKHGAEEAGFHYFVIKMPYSKVPRFIELPRQGDNYYLMFMEDIIKANVGKLFPGYKLDSSYSFKISRDADILIDDATPGDIVEKVKKKVRKRKIGSICRFVYERQMPGDFLHFLAYSFDIDSNEFVPGNKHLSLEDLQFLPNPNKALKGIQKPKPMQLECLNERQSIFSYVKERDLMIHFPYHSFDHLIHLLYEAVHDPYVSEIMITQYRVAENSTVINTLISAAQNGKKVTVFVELKARFDEENNLATAEMMKHAGINIIFSIPGLKVHAKVALIVRRNDTGKLLRSYAYISTGNFNEKTARLYADTGVFTCNKVIVEDLYTLFSVLERKIEVPVFNQLLVAQFNLIPELKRMINHEIELAEAGRQGRIILKMNALQDPDMINELYRASEAGVHIDLIVRGICCLIPEQAYSRNIRVTRIVDSFLEHTRIWYFGNDGDPKVYLGSADWMRRNLYRRIEAVVPLLDKSTRQQVIDMLHIQLNDNVKACWVNAKLENVFKCDSGKEEVRSQYTFYDYLKERNIHL